MIDYYLKSTPIIIWESWIFEWNHMLCRRGVRHVSSSDMPSIWSVGDIIIIIYMLVFKYYSREYTHKFLKLLCAWLLGTTGKPKGVTISHEALIIQSLAKIAIVGYSEDDVCHSLLHPVYVILPLYQNMRLSILSTIKILHNCIVNQAETKHSHVK